MPPAENPIGPNMPRARVSRALGFNKAAASKTRRLQFKGRGAPGEPALAPPPDVIHVVASLLRAAGPGVMAALGGDGLRLLSVSRPERQPESAALSGPGPGLCCWVSVFSCFSLACSYVGSLYVWKSELPRCGGCARGRDPRPREAGQGRSLGRRGWGRGGQRLLQARSTYGSLPRDHPAVIKRRFTSVLVVSSLSPLCVLLWRELTGIQVRRRRGAGNQGKDPRFCCGREHH